VASNDCITDTTRYSVRRAGLLFCIGFESTENGPSPKGYAQASTWSTFPGMEKSHVGRHSTHGLPQPRHKKHNGGTKKHTILKMCMVQQ